MGLDNSIEVKRTPFSTNLKELQPYAMTWDDKKQFDFEIAYWRKCWNVRAAILNCLDEKVNNYSVPLSVAEIDRIIEALKGFNKKNWEDMGSSIWTWQEQKPRLKEAIKNLERLKKLMIKYPELEVEFVDSY